MVAFTLNEIYFSEVGQEFALARQLYQDHGVKLLSLPGILGICCSNLSFYPEPCGATNGSHVHVYPPVGLVALQKTGGGCYSVYMVNETMKQMLSYYC